MNRLSQEKSPYLLQHKDNPVDWYPWSSEAFRKAKQEDKPILLSIGYSTCHWCHVMAHESFEDEETAEVLNRDFVCIKVDREERADIDAVYMKVCQAMTGSGGWPTTIFMTPEQKPFFAGTYFPRHNRYGQPGLIELSQSIARLWKSDRESLLRYGDQIIAAITSQHNESGEPSRELIVCGEQIPPEILSLHQHDLNILFKSSANAGRLAACAPFTLSYPVPDHGSTGYLCENGACRKTDTDLRALIL